MEHRTSKGDEASFKHEQNFKPQIPSKNKNTLPQVHFPGSYI